MTILTKLKKEEFNEILKNYEIGSYKSSEHMWWALDNTVYTLKTSEGKFIFKIFERSDPDFIKYQIRIIQFLEKNKIPVQKIIETKDKKNLFIYKGKRIVIYKFIEGDKLKKFNNKLIKNLAKEIASLNKNLLKLKFEGKYTWDDFQFKPQIHGSREIEDFDFQKNEDELLFQIKELKRENLRKSTIHGDLCESNLLVKNDKLVGIIDWDDVHEDYFIMELAVFIAQSFINDKGVNKDRIRLFLKEYQKYMKLNQEEKKALYYFIKVRHLGAISWCAKGQKTHKDRKKKIARWIKGMIKMYNNFNKLPLKEFMELF